MKKLFTLSFALVASLAVMATQGALSGRFTINAQGDQVVFSQGNLQYVGTWQFATNQWDIIGNAQADDHRDLLGWGTGDAPNKVSTNYNDYATFVDWGVNPITNGGNAANLWRSLTKEEWFYLFFTRTNAATLFALGSVNGINGTILLPDNWTLPEGASFTASTTQGLENRSWYYYNSSGNNFSHNTYTAAQWEIMESAGAVFLPTTGFRDGADVYNVVSSGYYWSVTPAGNNYAYNFFFGSSNFRPKDENGNRSDGRSVRLVQAAPACNIEPTDIYETACDSFPWQGTMYYASEDITKTLVAQNGCDSVVTLHLTINYSTAGSETQTAVGSYEWQGATYTESGEYQYTLTNAAGCDSIVTLVLTIIPTWKVTIEQPEVGGEISLSEVNNDINLDAVPDGTELHFVATAEEGYRLDSWIGCEDGELTVTEDASISCVFVPDDQAVDEVNTSEQKSARKHLQEGIFLIEKNGKLYNATGAEVK